MVFTDLASSVTKLNPKVGLKITKIVQIGLGSYQNVKLDFLDWIFDLPTPKT